MQRVPPQRRGAGGRLLRPRSGPDVDIAELERYFAINGYHRASTVSERGEFAIRGGVIDVFPPGADEPVRLDLFGDTLESIRAFDPRDPALDPAAEERRPAAGQRGAARRRRRRPLPQGLCRGLRRARATIRSTPRSARARGAAGMEHWLPLFYEQLETLFDYLPARRPDRPRPPGRRGPRRAPGDDRRRLRGPRAGRAQGALPRRCRPSALYLDQRRSGTRRLAGRPVRRFTPVPAGGRAGRRRHGRQARAQLRRRAGAGQRQPVRGGRRPRPHA